MAPLNSYSKKVLKYWSQLGILNQNRKNKTKRIELEYYEDDFDYDYDKELEEVNSNTVKSNEDKLKKDKILSVEADYQYPGQCQLWHMCSRLDTHWHAWACVVILLACCWNSKKHLNIWDTKRTKHQRE